MVRPVSMYRQTTVLLLCAAMALGAKASLTASAGIETATLRKIASRVDDRAGVIAIEASAPVAYIAAQPVARTFGSELRDVLASGFADNFTRDPRHPFSSVSVDSSVAADGIAVARVSMALTEPLRPRVRSSRNVIYVEADRLDRARTGASGVAAPASALLHISAARRGPATAVTLYGSGRLTASRVDTPADGTPRLVLDLANATSAVPRTTAVGEGPVDKVRIGLSSSAPLMTQVVMDLTRRVPYRLETSPDGHELTVVFDPPSPEGQLSASARQGPPSPTVPPSPTADGALASAGQALPRIEPSLPASTLEVGGLGPVLLQAAAARQTAPP